MTWIIKAVLFEREKCYQNTVNLKTKSQATKKPISVCKLGKIVKKLDKLAINLDPGDHIFHFKLLRRFILQMLQVPRKLQEVMLTV